MPCDPPMPDDVTLFFFTPGVVVGTLTLVTTKSAPLAVLCFIGTPIVIAVAAIVFLFLALGIEISQVDK